MRTTVRPARLLAALAAMSFMIGIAQGQDAVIWDLAELGRFDQTEKNFAVVDGRATVDLRSDNSWCPSSLGAVGERGFVREAVVVFESPTAATRWLHVSWNSGGIGKKQLEVACNGSVVGRTELVDAAATPDRSVVNCFEVSLKEGVNELAIRLVEGNGMQFTLLALSTSSARVVGISPNLKFARLEPYTEALGEPGIMLDSPHVRLMAPKRLEGEARVVFKYLIAGYDELRKITGIDTPYKVVVQSLGPDHPYSFGGTTVNYCVIRYDYTSLELGKQEEWRKHRVPHMRGYFEEMAHDFCFAANSVFGDEAVGCSLGIKVTTRVAFNPTIAEFYKDGRASDAKTWARFVAAGHRLPRDLPINYVDGVHRHLLLECERRYGPKFWQDYFAELRKEKANLEAAGRLSDGTARRNARYQICVDCFDRLRGINFKKRLSENGISTTVEIGSLYKSPDWNRKYE
jgi:hypothetical protein